MSHGARLVAHVSIKYYPETLSSLQGAPIEEVKDEPPVPSTPEDVIDGEKEQGGDGTYNWETDGVELTPSMQPATSVMLNVYNLSATQLQTFKGAIFGPPNVTEPGGIYDLLTKMTTDLSSLVVGCHRIPISIQTGETSPIVCGKVLTDASGIVVYNPIKEIDMGSITIDKRYASYLDYAPYTSISIFIPFCGEYSLDVDMVMGKTLNLKYRINVTTGDTVAILTTTDEYNKPIIVGQYSGNCAENIPLSGQDYHAYIGNALNIGSYVSTQSASVIGASVSNGLSSGKEKVVLEGEADTNKATPSITGGWGKAVMSGIQNAISPVYTHTGTLSSNMGYMMNTKAFIIIKSPRWLYNKGEYNYYGAKDWSIRNIGDCVGFNKFLDVRLETTASENEKEEIRELLYRAVIL